jgi:hypothetical protein
VARAAGLLFSRYESTGVLPRVNVFERQSRCSVPLGWCESASATRRIMPRPRASHPRCGGVVEVLPCFGYERERTVVAVEWNAALLRERVEHLGDRGGAQLHFRLMSYGVHRFVLGPDLGTEVDGHTIIWVLFRGHKRRFPEIHQAVEHLQAKGGATPPCGQLGIGRRILVDAENPSMGGEAVTDHLFDVTFGVLSSEVGNHRRQASVQEPGDFSGECGRRPSLHVVTKLVIPSETGHCRRQGARTLT